MAIGPMRGYVMEKKKKKKKYERKFYRKYMPVDLDLFYKVL